MKNILRGFIMLFFFLGDKYNLYCYYMPDLFHICTHAYTFNNQKQNNVYINRLFRFLLLSVLWDMFNYGFVCEMCLTFAFIYFVINLLSKELI